MLKHENSRGMTLLVLIIGFVIMSGLAASMSNFYNTSSVSSINDISYLNAYYLAESGVRYARMKQLDAGTTKTYVLGSTGNTVSVAVHASNGTTSTGVYASGTGLQSTRVVNDTSYKGRTSPATNPSLNNIIYSKSSKVTLSNSSNFTNTVSIVANEIQVDSSTVFNENAALISLDETKVMKIANGVKFKGTSNYICTQGSLLFDANADFSGTIYAGGKVKLSNPSKIIGSIYALGDVDCDSNVTISSGSIHMLEGKTAGSLCPNVIHDLPATYTIPCSDDNAYATPTVTSFTTTSSGPTSPSVITTSTTGDLYYTNGSKNIFVSGSDIYLNSVKFDSNCSICFDLCSNKNINLYVTNNFETSNNFSVKVSYKDNDGKCQSCTPMKNVPINFASNVYLETHGGFNASGAQSNVDWFGAILAKYAIKFGNQDKIVGAYASVNGPIQVDSNVTFTYVKSSHAE